MLILAFFIGLNPPKFMIDLALYSAAGVCAFIPTMVGIFWVKKSVTAAFLSSSIGLVILALFAMNEIRPWGFHEGFIALAASSVIYITICFMNDYFAKKAKLFQ